MSPETFDKMTDYGKGQFLLEMASIYPGDVTGEITKEACQLMGIEYEPIEIKIEYI